MTGVGPDLFEVLAAVGAVDILPAATIPTGRSGTQPDIRGAQVPAVLALSDTLSDTSAVLAGGVDTGLDTLDGDPSGAIALSDIPTGGPDSLGAQVPAVLTLSDTLSDTSAVLAGGVDTGLDSLDGDLSSAVNPSDTSAGTVVVPDPLTIAVELVRNDRTGLRWRDRAVNHLATELNKDLSDASNDEVQLAVTAA